MHNNFNSKIIIIDDDLDSIRLFESCLRPLGYQIDKAFSGKEALKLLSKNLPDLVILDVLLPDSHGFEICKIIKKELAKGSFIPVIMVTALNTREDKIKGLQSGADDFISKPIDIPELIAKINAMLRIRELNRRLQKSYDRLKKLEKAKELLVQMLIHDLKNPLSALVGSLELISIKTKGVIPQEASFSPQNALRIIERILSLIQNFLDIARIEEGKMKVNYSLIYIEDLFKEIISIFKSEASRKKAKIYYELDKNVYSIKADKDLLTRILENLVSNALKNLLPFEKRPGFVALKVKLDEKKENIIIQVCDNGCGISKENFTKIFDKFAQFELKKQTRFHTGLGLPFCKLAVEAHGGHIWVESILGEGSTFSFTIPLNPI